MGTIRMVMLDGLSVADLLALRQGGFFEGAEVRLPSTGVPVVAPMLANITLTETRPVTAGLPPPAAEATGPVAVPTGVLSIAAPVKMTVEQAATMAEFHKEAAEIRAEMKLPPAEPPAPLVSTSPGLPSVAQLAACTKLRDAMQLLIEGGMPAEELAAYLESVRDQVPLLGRISNIADRVSRTLSVMGQGG